MAMSTFDKKIVIKDPKAVDLFLDGLSRPADESKKPNILILRNKWKGARSY